MQVRFFVFVIPFVLSSAACVSNINRAKLSVDIQNVRQSKILPLKNANDDLILFDIASQVMEQSGFLNLNGESYGYYAAALQSNSDAAPNFFAIGWVNGLTVFIPSLLGLPTDLKEFDISAYLYIFDSAGTMIKVYKYSDSFNKLSGLYYGQDPNKKASRYYTHLYKKILQQIDAQNEEINFLLKKAGPITNENMQAARSKISVFFNLNKAATSSR